MPVTVSYDFRGAEGNQLNILRTSFERFGFRRLGNSLFRHDANVAGDDWLNCIAPAMMFFRSYVLHHNMQLIRFTVDCHGASFIDFSGVPTFGELPLEGANLHLAQPTLQAGTDAALTTWVDDCTAAAP